MAHLKHQKLHRLNSMIESVKNITQSMKIVLVNFEEEEVRQWDASFVKTHSNKF